MQEVGVLFLFDGSLHLVEGLFDELTVLHVEDAVSVAFDFWVMRHHHASCRAVLTFALRADAVDVQDQVHNSDYRKQISSALKKDMIAKTYQ